MPRERLDDKIRYTGNGQYGFGENNIGAVSIDIGKAMLTKLSDDEMNPCLFKISILGCGQRAGAIAFMLLTRGIASEIVMYDISASIHAEKEEDEEKEIEISNVKNINKQNENVATVRDLETCSLYYPSSAKITMGLDIQDIACSMIYIITSDFASMKTKFSLSASATNANISKLKENLQYISQNSRPDSIIINATEPGDLMTYAIWRWTGFPHEKVFGLGTSLAASHFKNEMAFTYNTAPESCDVILSGISTKPALIHDSVTFCGTKISDIACIVDEDIEDNKEFWEDAAASGALANKVIQDLKGGDTSSIWGAAAVISKMVDSIVNNSGALFNICTHIRGCRHGNKKDVYLSLPAIIGRGGVRYIVKQKMEDEDKTALQDCANLVFNVYPKLDLPGQIPQRDEKSLENSCMLLNKKHIDSSKSGPHVDLSAKASEREPDLLPTLVCPCPTESSTLTYRTCRGYISPMKSSKKSEMSEEIRVESLCSCFEKSIELSEEPSEKSDSVCECPASAISKSLQSDLSEMSLMDTEEPSEKSDSVCECPASAISKSLQSDISDMVSGDTLESSICSCDTTETSSEISKCSCEASSYKSSVRSKDEDSVSEITSRDNSDVTCICEGSMVGSDFSGSETTSSDFGSQTPSDASYYSTYSCTGRLKGQICDFSRTSSESSDGDSQTLSGHTTEISTSTMGSEISSESYNGTTNSLGGTYGSNYSKSDKSRSVNSRFSANSSICTCSVLPSEKSDKSQIDSLRGHECKVSKQSTKSQIQSFSYGSSQTVICDCSEGSKISRRIDESEKSSKKTIQSGSVFSHKSSEVSESKLKMAYQELYVPSSEVTVCNCSGTSSRSVDTETMTEPPRPKSKKRKTKRARSKSPSENSSDVTICNCSTISEETSMQDEETNITPEELSKYSSAGVTICSCSVTSDTKSSSSFVPKGSTKLSKISGASCDENISSRSVFDKPNMGSQYGSWLADKNKPKPMNGSSIIKKTQSTNQPSKPSKISRISFDETACTCSSTETDSETSSASFYSAENVINPKILSEHSALLAGMGIIAEVTESAEVQNLLNKVLEDIIKDQNLSESKPVETIAPVCSGKMCMCWSKSGECLCYIKVLNELQEREASELPADISCICEEATNDQFKPVIVPIEPESSLKSEDSCICDEVRNKLSNALSMLSREESIKSGRYICNDAKSKDSNKSKESSSKNMVKKVAKSDEDTMPQSKINSNIITYQNLSESKPVETIEPVCSGKICLCRSKSGECLCYIKVLNELREREASQLASEKSDNSCICEEATNDQFKFKPVIIPRGTKSSLKSQDSCICDEVRDKSSLASSKPSREESIKRGSCICNDAKSKDSNKSKESTSKKIVKKPAKSDEDTLPQSKVKPKYSRVNEKKPIKTIPSAATATSTEIESKNPSINENKQIKKPSRTSSKSPSRSQEGKAVDLTNKSGSVSSEKKPLEVNARRKSPKPSNKSLGISKTLDSSQNESVDCESSSTTVTQEIPPRPQKNAKTENSSQKTKRKDTSEKSFEEICSKCCRRKRSRKLNLESINETADEHPAKSASEENPDINRCTCNETSSKSVSKA